MPDLSIVVPAHDEAGNILPLCRAITEAMPARLTYEVVLVDDASRDGTLREMLEVRAGDPRIRVLHNPSRSGKTGALLAGFHAASGRLLGTLDADMQSDPRDLVRCVDALRPDLQAVNGKRDRMTDSFVRGVSSKIGNGLRRAVLGGPLEDAGSGVRVFRRECLHAIPRIEGAHRFFGELMTMHGYKMEEIPIAQLPRHAGVAKYGVGNRALRGLIDLFGYKWLQARLTRIDADDVTG